MLKCSSVYNICQLNYIQHGRRKGERRGGVVCVRVCVCVCVGWMEDVLEIFCLALFFVGRVRAAYKSVLCVSEKYLALR